MPTLLAHQMVVVSSAKQLELPSAAAKIGFGDDSNFLIEPLRRALSCVTRAVADIRGGYFPALEPHPVTLNNGAPVRLPGITRIHLGLVLLYRIVEDIGADDLWKVITVGYYTLMDADQREIVAFHWHPEQKSPIAHPHLHLGPSARVGYDRLHRAHIPTGYTTIQDVLFLAINDLGVEPLIDRETALQTLTETQAQ